MGGMRRLTKLLLFLTAALIVLAGAGVAALVWLVDPNDYRERIAALVEAETGRELTIRGPLSLSFAPCCGVAVEDATLGNPAGFGDEDFARAEMARLGVRLWPLLAERELEITGLSLEGLSLALKRRADGSSNWSFSPDANTNEAAQTDNESDTASQPFSGLAIAEIDVEDSSVSYADEVEGVRYEFSDVALKTGRIAAADDFPLEASMDFAAPELGATGRVEAEASAALVSGEVPTIELTDLQATVIAMGLAQLESARATLATPAAKVMLGDVAVIELTGLSGELAGEDPSLPGGKVSMDIAVTKLAYAARTARVGRITANVESGGANAAVKVGFVEAGLQYWSSDGDIVIEEVSPREWLGALGIDLPPTADPQVFSRLSGKSRFVFDSKRRALTHVDIVLDDTRITGELAQRTDAPIDYSFSLVADQFDLDRYLPPDEAGTEGQVSAATGRGDNDGLKDLNLLGTLKLDKLQVGGAQLANVDSRLRAKNGVLTLDPLSAELYEGTYRGQLTINLLDAIPRVDAQQTLSGVKIDSLLVDVADVSELGGLVTARLQGSGSGLDADSLLASFSGDLSVNLTDGVFRGTDLWHEIRKARARVKGDPLPPTPASPETPLESLNIAGTLGNGRLNTSSVAARLSFMRLTGRGELGLLDQSLDYRLQAKVLDEPEFPDGEDLGDLNGLTIPVRLKGTVSEPKPAIDLGDLLKANAGRILGDILRRELGGDRDEAPAPEENVAPDGAESPEQPPAERRKPEDVLKDRLRDALGL